MSFASPQMRANHTLKVHNPKAIPCPYCYTRYSKGSTHFENCAKKERVCFGHCEKEFLPANLRQHRKDFAYELQNLELNCGLLFFVRTFEISVF